MISDHSLNLFLHFGYIPRAPSHTVVDQWKQLAAPCGENLNELTDKELLRVGIRALEGVFQGIPEGLQVVPLSGGNDSRAILAGLLKAGYRENIVAVSLGLPGTLDFEIGREIARFAGVRHEEINLANVRLNSDDILGTVRDSGGWMWLFGSHFLRLIFKKFGKDVTYWSGYLGGELGGAHIKPQANENWEVACQVFENWNRYCRSIGLARPSFPKGKSLPREPFLAKECLSYDDQLDFLLRQQCYIRPTVLAEGYNVRTPFLNPTWTRFILNTSWRHRLGQILYEQILETAYPDFFNLPTKQRLGFGRSAPRWLPHVKGMALSAHSAWNRNFPRLAWGLDPRQNYIDWDRALRQRVDLQAVVYDNLHDLKQRSIIDWIDLDNLENRHRRRQANHADALTLLASLEFCLKAELNSN